jgi:hypothetical protein
MPTTEWTQSDSFRAKKIWTEYQRQHDLSARIGQTVGIDPYTGRVWFGASIDDIVSQRDAEGVSTPLFFERVGSDTYYQKGRHW